MKISIHRKFKKKYVKLPNKLKAKVDDKIELFEKDHKDPQLKNHPLKGEASGLYSFSVTGDYRIIYYIEEDVAVFTDVGTHNQVYLKPDDRNQLFW